VEDDIDFPVRDNVDFLVRDELDNGDIELRVDDFILLLIECELLFGRILFIIKNFTILFKAFSRINSCLNF
jgi:hypothetical protein